LKLLLIHQNFPGQFRQLVPHLVERGHELRAICSHERPLMPEVLVGRYREPEATALPGDAPGLSFWCEASRRAPHVHRQGQQWHSEGWHPDLILGHSGWGETLLLRELWREVPQLIWPELWVDPSHAGIGVEPGRDEPTREQCLEFELRNQLTRAALSHANAWVVPTQHQAASFPPEFQGTPMHVIHEGIDCRLAAPYPQASYEVRGIRIDRSTPTITLVNRNLERLRGFHQFMRALPAIQRAHPHVRVLIVGDNGPGYGGGEPAGQPLKQQMLEELAGQLDLERIHFLGRIPYPVLLALLQASWVHVYLSYPFILGWSLLEAMACGCCIVGSEGPPVTEVIQHGHNGLLVPMAEPPQLANAVLGLLANSSLRQQLGEQARQDALAWDQNVMLPRLTELIESVGSNRSAS
jgi:glycosyltransferase involved in cell wall biosynthesis